MKRWVVYQVVTSAGHMVNVPKTVWDQFPAKDKRMVEA